MKAEEYWLSGRMVHAMLQQPTSTRAKALATIDIDEILFALSSSESHADAAPGRYGIMARRLSTLVGLPMHGQVAVLNAQGLERAWKGKVKLRLRGSVPYSYSINTVKAWFDYAQADVSFFLEDLSFEIVERAFFKVLLGVNDDTFSAIIANMRDRKSEMHNCIVVPPGITFGRDLSLGRRCLSEAWVTRWTMANPGASRILGTLDLPDFIVTN